MRSAGVWQKTYHDKVQFLVVNGLVFIYEFFFSYLQRLSDQLNKLF